MAIENDGKKKDQSLDGYKSQKLPTTGVDVKIRKVAPLGDPVEVTVRGYELSLRKADAEMIEVE